MSAPIKILHVFGRLDRGGAETMIMNIFRKIDRNKYQFDFIIHSTDECDYSSEIRKLGGKIFSIPKYNVRNHVSYVRKWEELFVNNSDYNIIHGHVRSTASIYLGIAKKHNMITIAHSHNTSSGKGLAAVVKDILQKRIKRHSDYLLACSNEAGKWLFGKRAIHKKNYFIMPNAIDMNKFSLDKNVRDAMRAKYKLDDKLVVGTIGRFTEQKNPYFILKIIKELVSIDENYIFLWVGDGELFEQIRANVITSGLNENVIFTGSINNANEIIMSMDLFLLPSKWEGLGIVLVEAQASNLVCLVSEQIPNEVIFTDLVYKLSLKLDEKNWATRINYLIKKALRDKPSIKKDNKFDIDDSVIWTQNFYKEILK